MARSWARNVALKGAGRGTAHGVVANEEQGGAFGVPDRLPLSVQQGGDELLGEEFHAWGGSADAQVANMGEERCVDVGEAEVVKHWVWGNNVMCS